ncbi:hypothetical protein M413DRAFT_210049 [Hebeloma cylindrosporum]|uniref:C3H1-type domain-containing protein n=1 Tax=Hebeloma cylindrosporum TaxID=76867 RepID=A0A0C3CVD2_HEBCY|nr:hypothetical protein M413DRAFT_210049 [Hebeloma cylindrosporum h7]
MVSPLWKACADGDLQRTNELLADATALDVELKDHTGVTPLIEAVRNGHIDVVRALLDKGADPMNASSQGPPEKYTADPAIVELLQTAQAKSGSAQQPTYTNDDQDKRFYGPPPPESYPYYPTINPSLSTVNEAGYYPAAQPTDANGIGNLPPPDIARLIPCRYFPACRYGAQCMFAHPQTPYFQGPMPSVQYPPYDPMGNGYVPQYYPPPSFQQQSSGPMSPPPGPLITHARTSSEVVSPSLGHFSPNSAPPPPPAPYGPLSPSVYPHPGPVPIAMSSIPPLHPHPQSSSQPHPNLYNSSSTSPVPPFPMHQDSSGPYPIPAPPSNINYADITGGLKPSPEDHQAENYNTHPTHREGMNHHRRGAGRRPSFNSRKPPCLFFPAGRCKNGDDCRFPHILPENGANAIQPQFPPVRGGPPRPRAQHNGVNGFGHLETKFGNMAIRDEPLPRQKNGMEGSSRSHSSEAGNRPKFQQGGKHPHNGSNGHAQKKTATFRHQQRVPNADEFPVLAGSTTPPNRTNGVNGHLFNGNGQHGPTAAQVLQAPAPPRKDGSKESSTRGTSPDPTRGNSSKEAKAEPNGIAHETPAPVQQEPVVNNVNKVPVMSFAAVATSGTTDVPKEVSVSA